MNTRFKGSEGAYLLEKSGARMLLTVTDFLDTNYIQLLDDAGRPRSLEEIVVISGDAPSDAVTWQELLDRAGSTTSAQSSERAASITPDDLSDLLFTSGTTGRPKGAMLLHGPSVKAYTAWSDVVGLQGGRPLPHRQPVLPHLRAEGRHPRLDPQGRHDRAPPGVRRAERDEAGGGGEDHDAPGAAGDLPDDPRPPRPRQVRPQQPAPQRHRRRRRAGRDDPAHARGAHVQDDRHRLWPHRDPRHRHDVPPRRRSRGHRQHRRAGDPRRRGARRRPGPQPGARRRAGRGHRPRLQRDEGLLRRRRGHPRHDRPRRLAAHRRHRRVRREQEPDDHRPHEGHVHRRRLQRLPG